MKHVFVFGHLAVTVRYWEERHEQVEAGARIELRRVEPLIGAKHRPGAAGFSVLPVNVGGIWRADLFTLISQPGNEPRHHYHPLFEDDDVGERVFEDELTEDPVGWTTRRLRDLRSLLIESGAEDIAGSVNDADFERALPAIRIAIENCLALTPTAPSPT